MGHSPPGVHGDSSHHLTHFHATCKRTQNALEGLTQAVDCLATSSYKSLVGISYMFRILTEGPGGVMLPTMCLKGRQLGSSVTNTNHYHAGCERLVFRH